MSTWSRARRLVPSPAMVVASMALAAALSGGAYAVTAAPKTSARPAKNPTKVGLYVSRATFGVDVGDVGTRIARCPKAGHASLAIGGGFQVTNGNFVSIVTATVTGDQTGFGVTAVVPNAIDSPGVMPAQITVKVICIDKDQVIFGELQN